MSPVKVRCGARTSRFLQRIHARDRPVGGYRTALSLVSGTPKSTNAAIELGVSRVPGLRRDIHHVLRSLSTFEPAERISATPPGQAKAWSSVIIERGGRR